MYFNKSEWNRIKHGKVHDVFQSRNGKCVVLWASDRVSANDAVLEGVEIPNKGRFLTAMSAKWAELTDDVAMNAVIADHIRDMPPVWRNSAFDGRVIEMLALKMIPIEAVVRGYITGSMWEKYRNGRRRFNNNVLPDGLLEAMRLPTPFYTPTTKSSLGEHDQELDFDGTIAVIAEAGFDNPRELAERIRNSSLELYHFCAKYAKEHGVILADTKFEFGVDMDTGKLYVADEICTCDSSRFWLEEDYIIGHPQKQVSTFIVRDWVKNHEGEPIPTEVLQETSKAYHLLYERLFDQKLATP